MDFVYCVMINQLQHNWQIYPYKAFISMYLFNVIVALNHVTLNGSAIITIQLPIFPTVSFNIILQILKYAFLNIRIVKSRLDKSLYILFIICDGLQKYVPLRIIDSLAVNVNKYKHNIALKPSKQLESKNSNNNLDDFYLNLYEKLNKLRILSSMHRTNRKYILKKIFEFKKKFTLQYVSEIYKLK